MVIHRGFFRSYEDRQEEIQAIAAYWVAREQSGRMREAERMELREWLARSPAHELEYQLADHLYASNELEAALELAPRISPPRRFVMPPISHLVRRAANRTGHISRPVLAGALSLALSLGGLYQFAPEMLPGWLFPAAPADDVRKEVLRTENGERMVTHLADGTRLYLDGGTEMEVSISAGRRHVRLLRGNALFDVARDEERPFIVDAARAHVRVLGTQFLISDRETRTAIDVFRGLVQIDPANMEASSLRVRGGMRVTVGDEIVQERLGAQSAEDWRAGWVDEDALTLRELARLMSIRTGRRIEVEQALENLVMSGRFRISDPEVTLKRLAQINGFSIVYDEEVIKIINNTMK